MVCHDTAINRIWDFCPDCVHPRVRSHELRSDVAEGTRFWCAGFQELIALSLRRIPVRKTVDVRIVLIKSGFNVSVDDLSTHHLAVGDVHMVAAGMIKAKEKKYRFKF